MKNEPKLGEVIENGITYRRDAIHIAVAPVVAEMDGLGPGQKVGFLKPNDVTKVGFVSLGEEVGVVDPYLKEPVRKGEWFWMLLFPQTITDLTHHWEHPAFISQKADKEESYKWIREFAEEHRFCTNYYGTYTNLQWRCYTAEEIIEAGKEFLLHGDRLVQVGATSLRDDPWDIGEFWRHFEVVTEMPVPEYHKDTKPFCCTC